MKINKKHKRELSQISFLKTTKRSRSHTIINSNFINSKNLDLNDALNQFFQKSSEFKCIEQKLAIEKILNKVIYLFYIAGIDSDKSLLYMLLAFLNLHQIYIVLVSLIALKSNLKQKSLKLKLNAEIFEESLNNTVNIQYVSFESIITIKFYDYIIKLKAQNKDITIFINECHLIITQSHFKYIMKYLNSLNQYEINMIFLTATFTKEIQSMLFSLMNINLNTEVLHLNTSRKNIKYTVKEVKKSEYLNQVAEILEFLIRHMNSIEKIIIFVDTVNHCKEIAKSYNYCKFYANYKYKFQDLKRFEINSNEMVLIAT